MGSPFSKIMTDTAHWAPETSSDRFDDPTLGTQHEIQGAWFADASIQRNEQGNIVARESQFFTEDGGPSEGDYFWPPGSDETDDDQAREIEAFEGASKLGIDGYVITV